MKQSEKAFTLLELCVVVALVALLAVLLIPAMASARTNTQKINCLNNLKQIGLGLRLWEGSHGNKYPQGVSSSAGGANEFCAHGNGTVTPTVPTRTKTAGMVFMVMSNQLASPKVLFCPSDNIHFGAATNFSYGDLLSQTGPPAAIAAEINTKISYFINGDASEANPQDVMSGDCNIGNVGAATASSPAFYRFSNSGNNTSTADSGEGLTSTAWTGIPFWSWTQYDFHKQSGNLLMADGSCQSVGISGLHTYLSNSTNSAAGEAFSFLP